MRKKALLLLAGGLVICLAQAGQMGDLPCQARTVSPRKLQSSFDPRIRRARLKGKKLIVEGETFGAGAVILVDGDEKRTRNNDEFPTRVLIAPKAGSKIPRDEVVRLQVRNADESVSEDFLFYTGFTIAPENAYGRIHLKVGDRFMVFFNPYQTPLLVVHILLDFRAFTPIDLGSVIPGSQGVFQALLPGQYQLIVDSGYMCPPPPIPCPQLPVVRQVVSITVK